MSIANLAAKTEAGFAALAESISRSFDYVGEQIQGLRSDVNERFERVDRRFEQIDARFREAEDRFQSVEMKILGVNNRIDILIDRTPSREEFDRLEYRVATTETRRRR